MQRNATEKDDEPGELTAAQQQVLACLLAGSTVTAAAEAARVDRTTVHRWLRSDFDFQAALNRARRELRDAMASRLHDSAQRAVETVCAAVSAGDAKIAIALLKGLGLLDGKAIGIGIDKPAVLREETSLAEREAESDRRLRHLTAF